MANPTASQIGGSKIGAAIDITGGWNSEARTPASEGKRLKSHGFAT
jgi:hypothetical protein